MIDATVEAYLAVEEMQEAADYLKIDMDVFRCYRANTNWSGWKNTKDLIYLQDRQLQCCAEILECKVRYHNGMGQK